MGHTPKEKINCPNGKPGPLGTRLKSGLLWKSLTPGGDGSGADAAEAFASGCGPVLNPTNSIHMCFMRFAIDAVYFNDRMEIVKIVKNLHPGWVFPPA